MLPLDAKQSEVKMHSLSDLRCGLFVEEVSRNRKRKRDILLGTWNFGSLYRAGSLKAAARELARYKLDLVGVQEVRWAKGAQYEQGTIIFLWEGK